MLSPAVANRQVQKQQAAGGNSKGTAQPSAPCWQLCQVAAVLAGTGADPAHVQVQLVGGGSVKAGAVSSSAFADIANNEVRLAR